MKYIQLDRVSFDNLKGLKSADIYFSKTLTAIMGVNGAGKSTIIHALACMFKPDKQGAGQNYRFPNFFVPNPDTSWTGSRFTAFYSIVDKEAVTQLERTYEKKADRWSPRYENRPKRNIYYLGIDTCLPEIERNTTVSAIHYETKIKTDKVSNKILADAAYILNKPYINLTDNAYSGKKLVGVKRSDGLNYSSLSMGTGEQRIIKILNVLHTVEIGSLVLIDEIDLLLHISALRRLIEKIHAIAETKKVQIVFSTHSPLMTELQEYVFIQYVEQSSIAEKTKVYTNISSDLLYGLTGRPVRPLTVYVEDSFSRAIIRSIAKRENIQQKVNIISFGASNNGYTIAADKALEGIDTENILVVLDGDVDRTQDAKKEKLEKCLSGNEEHHDQKIETALSVISQYSLPEGQSPEKFMHSCLVNCSEKDCEIVQIANDINAVADSHEWIHQIADRLDQNEESTARDIIELICDSTEWEAYIAPIREWLFAHKDA